ncbi:uncharacterized protein BT62DRAFT_934758 [Guyanagaster necrorhizus]|uniref:Uncharacterized protein n=1 Tax=Guyanagaster necrorhizus TaxID=856835 RepID=A0A9P8AQA4_9AGAR|nr:uncharacterized protein BT62DRAFT_934758 [Guyanagaster necrorhizus MCA 3950]KAG7443795.1 hypothetical protein BT62DRAFT_934758 [Guyanagaster necrorhizus MCA 3950]
MGSFSTPEGYFIGLGCEVFLHGLYTGLFLASMYLLLFKKKKNRVVAVMTLVNCLMYAVATAHMIINFRQNFAAFLWHNGAKDDSVFHDTSSVTQWSQLMLEVVNIALGDGIVIWRAWILWNRRWWIILSSVLLLLGTMASGIGLVYTVATAPTGVVFTDPRLEVWAVAFILSTFSTNAWATTLVAYRTWLHFKLVRHLTGVSILGSFRKRSAILPILIESGTLYCCTWLIVIAIFLSSSNAIYIMIDTISQLTAIYPTLIITLVCVRSTLDIAIETVHQTQTQNQAWTQRPTALTQASVEDFTDTASLEPSIPMRLVTIGFRSALDGSGGGPPHLGSMSSESVRKTLCQTKADDAL